MSLMVRGRGYSVHQYSQPGAFLRCGTQVQAEEQTGPCSDIRRYTDHQAVLDQGPDVSAPRIVFNSIFGFASKETLTTFLESPSRGPSVKCGAECYRKDTGGQSLEIC